MSINRRGFIQQSMIAPGVVTLSGALPGFLQEAGAAIADEPQEKVLVVVQLSGGNDGLNTIVPLSDPIYRKRRPTLAISKPDALGIDDEAGWHPNADGLAELLEENAIAAIQGVGYDRPNRSHFESMDIWHSCDRKGSRRPDGWIGRFLDETLEAHGDAPAMHLGDKKAPLALAAQTARAASVRSLDQFRLQTDDAKLKGDVERMTAQSRGTGGLLGFVQTSSQAALAASRRVEKAGKDYKTDVDYPNTRLAGRLKTVAQLIDAQLATRIYYVELDGFDTHSRQAPAHGALMTELGGALNAFVKDLKQHGHSERVLTMCFSEFGRRVEENASEGTDHGAAGPMLLAGPVKPGLYGPRPNLESLHQGDVKYAIDFRRIYATVLEQWLKTPSEEILGGEYKQMSLLKVKA